MKKIYRKGFIAALISLTLVSCNLDLFPEATVIPGDEPFFGTEKDVTDARPVIYSLFRGECGGAIAYIPDLMLQGFNATAGYGNRLGEVHRTDDTFTASTDEMESVWAAYYQRIFQYNNYILSADDKFVLESSFAPKAQAVKAEALIARAYSYLQLARLFGVPYNTETASVDLCVPLVLTCDKDALPVRATVQKVYDQIAEDLADAREIYNTPASKSYLAANSACAEYFTPDVISCIEARMLLDTKHEREAAELAASIIDGENSPYALSETVADLRKVQNEDTGKEAIMQCYSSKKEGSASYGIFTGYGKNRRAPNEYAYSPDFLPSRVLIDAYDSKDIRWGSWFEMSGNVATTAPIFMNGSLSTGVYLFVKYKGNRALHSNGLQKGLVAAKPFMVSELYLIAAEGFLAAGDKSKATSYLGRLQDARKADRTLANESNIGKEWFRETIGEGLYFFYLKRNGCKGFNGRAAHEYALERNLIQVGSDEDNDFTEKIMLDGDKAFCWPIPTREIQCNRNLVQNDGYGR